MSDFHPERFDLNLLRIFRAVYAERSVTAAAERLGVSQSAVSHGLRRLRDAFHDELFVRSGLGIVPTPRAEQLYAPIEQMMETLDTQVLAGLAFDPHHVRREFALAMVDMTELVFLPPLLKRLAIAAPGCTLRIKRVHNDGILDALESGGVELAIGHIPEAHRHVYRQTLFLHDFVVLAWDNHPRIREDSGGTLFDWAAFAREPHIVVSSGTDQHLVKTALEPRGIQRRVALTVGGFLAVPWLLQGTEMLATVPTRLGEHIARAAQVRQMALPEQIEPYPLQTLWHPRWHNDAGHRWLRQTVFDVMHGYPQLR